MRPEFLWPSAELSAEGLRDVLLVVCADVPAGVIEGWTEYERMLAYDWAAREHLHASDNPIPRRPRPSFLTQVNPGHVAELEHLAAAILATFTKSDAGYRARVGQVQIKKWEATLLGGRLSRFEAYQARDGLPDPDTGQTHCTACHGVDGNPDGPSCGHTAGCPEC